MTSGMNHRCINDWTTHPIICTLMSLSGVRRADIMRALAAGGCGGISKVFVLAACRSDQGCIYCHRACSRSSAAMSKIAPSRSLDANQA